mmetsp:Transcript_17824/g.38184  ORF Transcript_17824/g.38184 Transcript_17824/m.38184 type:complete len:181 (-) Transcript_17824:33-575(-)
MGSLADWPQFIIMMCFCVAEPGSGSRVPHHLQEKEVTAVSLSPGTRLGPQHPSPRPLLLLLLPSPCPLPPILLAPSLRASLTSGLVAAHPARLTIIWTGLSSDSIQCPVQKLRESWLAGLPKAKEFEVACLRSRSLSLHHHVCVFPICLLTCLLARSLVRLPARALLACGFQLLPGCPCI